MSGLEGQKLNIAAELPSSVVNGPGTRYVIWVQGCPFKCPGCFNLDFQPLINKTLVSVEELADRILSVKDIEGVTYSGGEPMIQAEPLYSLSSLLKKHRLTVLCYSGFTLEQLHHRNDPYISKLLSLLDILIDGPYVEEKKANLLWRGSINQQVHFMTEVYSDCKLLIEQDISEMEIAIGEEGMVLTGITRKEIVKRLLKIVAGG